MLGWLVVNRAPEARSRLGVWAVAMLAALVLSAVTAEPAGASIWAIQRAPAVAGAKDSVLQSVSCTAAVACIAVGGPDQRPGVMLAEGWDGSRWTVQPTPRPRGSIQSFLSGVSCVSESSCMAVGFAVDSNGAVRVVTTRWTGLSWALVPGAKGRRSIPSFLASVSCTSLTECTAVGASENRSGTFFPLVERWNGSRWLVQATPRLPDSQLAGVSCASARACTAVGDYAGVAELVEHWNGTRWSRDLRANLVSGESGLGAVSCTSPTSCAAGGALMIPSMITWPLLETWAGSRWSAEPTRGQPPGVVYGVSCTSRTACTAVGEDSLVEELKGDRWSIDRAPDPQDSTLYGVSCIGQRCVAVGSWIEPRGSEVPLVEWISSG